MAGVGKMSCFGKKRKSDICYLFLTNDWGREGTDGCHRQEVQET